VYPLFAAGVVLGLVALIVCHAKNYLLLYGDAVAHLGIARRIVDSHYPGLGQLGGVWLPLPHLLMLPFIGNMAMWQTGFAAVPMSMLSYALSVAGVWRLGRRMMRPRWALVATAFYALNANLLYLSTTAMTEALFLCLLVWTVVAAVETVAAMRAGRVRGAGWGMAATGLLVLGQVMTRYDGWIIGAVVWCWIAWEWWQSGNAMRRRLRVSFAVFTLLCVAGPAFWFWYNQHFEHDWLDFMRGPYSASAIERKTAPPGQHYRGWHNPGWAVAFYTRTAQVDAAAWECGFGLMAASLWGLWVQWRRTALRDVGQPVFTQEDRIVEGRSVSRYRGLSSAALDQPSQQAGRGPRRRASGRDDRGGVLCARGIALLWVPLPFYVYAVAYGSVPIFIPQLWPHSYYNARYGMEMLPALALYGALAAERMDVWLRGKTEGWARVGARLWQPLAMVLCVANCIAMMYAIPLVLKEGMVNARTRVPFERALAVTLDEFPASAPVMMSTSAHVGAVQTAGRTMRSMVSEDDEVAWEQALADPAHHAAYVIAMAGDPVAKAVAAHPEGLQELQVICTTGQPCAKVYQSELWTGESTR
jgi:4-amino-4-deoxy-L-arabinose transferase-like glycosyltransferase